MNNGVNLRNGGLISTADLGGQRILGMSGSLINYINTGVATPLDSYQASKNIQVNKNKPINFEKALKVAIVGLGVVATALLFVKKGDIEKIKNTASGFFTKTTDKIKRKL